MTPLDFSRKRQLSLMEMLRIKAEVSNKLNFLVYRAYQEELTDCYFQLFGCFELLTEYHSVKTEKTRKAVPIFSDLLHNENKPI